MDLCTFSKAHTPCPLLFSLALGLWPPLWTLILLCLLHGSSPSPQCLFLSFSSFCLMAQVPPFVPFLLSPCPLFFPPVVHIFPLSTPIAQISLPPEEPLPSPCRVTVLSYCGPLSAPLGLSMALGLCLGVASPFSWAEWLGLSTISVVLSRKSRTQQTL